MLHRDQRAGATDADIGRTRERLGRQLAYRGRLIVYLLSITLPTGRQSSRKSIRG